jgi:hypothetical protein
LVKPSTTIGGFANFMTALIVSPSTGKALTIQPPQSIALEVEFAVAIFDDMKHPPVGD